MATWPASLPQKQFIGLTERDQDNVARTEMDAGPATRRRRATATARDVSVPIVLTGAQKQTLDTFFRTTLKHGSLVFDWEDPTTDATVEFAFKNPPRWALDVGGSTNERKWSTVMELEIQP